MGGFAAWHIFRNEEICTENQEVLPARYTRWRIPHQTQLSKSIDSEAVLIQAAEILNCKLEQFQKTARVSQSDILDRDMLIYLMWQSGQLTNVQIAEKFGLTYSAVSRRVGVFKNLLRNNKTLQNKFSRVKSLIKI